MAKHFKCCGPQAAAGLSGAVPGAPNLFAPTQLPGSQTILGLKPGGEPLPTSGPMTSAQSKALTRQAIESSGGELWSPSSASFKDQRVGLVNEITSFGTVSPRTGQTFHNPTR